MPAGVYDVPVIRGPDHDVLDDDNSLHHPRSGPGVVLEPNDSVLREWAECWVSDGPEGMWSPRRSCVVAWDDDPSRPLWYKAGDSGMFDISWRPCEDPVPSLARFSAYKRVCEKFDVFVRAAYRHHGREHEVDAALAMDRAEGHWLGLAIQ